MKLNRMVYLKSSKNIAWAMIKSSWMGKNKKKGEAKVHKELSMFAFISACNTGGEREIQMKTILQYWL